MKALLLKLVVGNGIPHLARVGATAFATLLILWTAHAAGPEMLGLSPELGEDAVDVAMKVPTPEEIQAAKEKLTVERACWAIVGIGLLFGNRFVSWATAKHKTLGAIAGFFVGRSVTSGARALLTAVSTALIWYTKNPEYSPEFLKDQPVVNILAVVLNTAWTQYTSGTKDAQLNPVPSTPAVLANPGSMGLLLLFLLPPTLCLSSCKSVAGDGGRMLDLFVARFGVHHGKVCAEVGLPQLPKEEGAPIKYGASVCLGAITPSRPPVLPAVAPDAGK